MQGKKCFSSLLRSPKADEISAALSIPFPFKRPSLDQQDGKHPRIKK